MGSSSSSKPPFQSVQSAKLSDQISRQLLETIVSGHYQPGDLLPSERDLASIFDVSRVVVREALTSLTEKGIISVRQGRGATVNSAENWNTFDPDVLMLLHGDRLFDDVMEMRRIFEPELAALAAAAITSEQVEELRTLSDLPDTDTVEQHIDRDTAYHIAIAKATQNPVLVVVLTSISDLLRECRRRTFQVPGELAKARYWHHAVFEAIEARDPKTAHEAMASHMGQVKDGLEAYATLSKTKP